MKNKIKYIIGILSLLLIIGLPQNLQAAGGFILPTGPIQMQINTTKEIQVIATGLGAGLGAYTINVLSNNLTVVTITGNNPINVGETEVGQVHVITLNSGATAGSAIITFDSSALSIADQTLPVTVSTTTGGGEVVLADECGASTENICKPESNLVCTPCGNKVGLPCDDSQASVCLGDVGYNGNPDDVANFPSCDVGRLGTGVTTLVKDNYACSSGLICQNKQCVNDFGGQALTNLGIGKATTDIRDQIRSFINIALGFLGVAGAIIVLYGGVLWMTARGNDEQVTKAKSTIVSGVVGIIIILLAWTIVSYVLKLGGQITT